MLKNMKFEQLVDAKQIREIIKKYFDVIFWEDELIDNTVEESIANTHTPSDYILFTLNNTPCALTKITVYDYETLTLDLMEVEDDIIGRNKGIGREVVKHLKSIYPDYGIYGYSTPQAARFWARNSVYFDDEAYEKIQSCEFEAGGLMQFDIS